MWPARSLRLFLCFCRWLLHHGGTLTARMPDVPWGFQCRPGSDILPSNAPGGRTASLTWQAPGTDCERNPPHCGRKSSPPAAASRSVRTDPRSQRRCALGGGRRRKRREHVGKFRLSVVLAGAFAAVSLGLPSRSRRLFARIAVGPRGSGALLAAAPCLFRLLACPLAGCRGAILEEMSALAAALALLPCSCLVAAMCPRAWASCFFLAWPSFAKSMARRRVFVPNEDAAQCLGPRTS